MIDKMIPTLIIIYLFLRFIHICVIIGLACLAIYLLAKGIEKIREHYKKTSIQENNLN